MINYFLIDNLVDAMGVISCVTRDMQRLLFGVPIYSPDPHPAGSGLISFIRMV